MALTARTVRRLTLPVGLAIFSGAALGYSSTTFAGTKLQGEAVDSYSACGAPSLGNNITNVNGFLAGMTTSGGVSWPVLNFWQNSNVWDKDFIDSNLNGNGTDTTGFDWNSNTVAIAYYSGHGLPTTYPDWDTVCDNISGLYQPHCCSTSADCTTPAAGQSLPGACTRGPNYTGRRGYCMYKVPRQVQVCSGSDAFSHKADITTMGKFGESSNSGSWGGGSTNGGINFAVMDMSIAVRPGQELSEIGPTFAGLHNYATVMPTTGGADINDASYRGANFAAFWQMNSASSPAFSWAFSIYSAPTSALGGGTACTLSGTDGGRGINGCGAYWVGTLALNSTQAWFLNTTEDWVGMQNDANDATGGGWISWTYYCNYDCNTYPIKL